MECVVWNKSYSSLVGRSERSGGHDGRIEIIIIDNSLSAVYTLLMVDGTTLNLRDELAMT
jgi:hypothetical protein